MKKIVFIQMVITVNIANLTKKKNKKSFLRILHIIKNANKFAPNICFAALK